MAAEAGNAGGTGGDSGVGSPAAGAVSPGEARQRMSDLGVPSGPPQSGRARASDLGVPGRGVPVPDGNPIDPGPAPERMVPLTNPFGRQDSMHQELDPNAPTEMQPIDPADMQDAQTPDAEPQPGQPLTPEQQAAKYAEWMDSDQIPEEFLDRPIWVPQGKGEPPIPVRLRDAPQNMMLYNDYQHKTAQLAAKGREYDAFKQGRDRWLEDMVSGDGERGMRAMRAMGADRTLHALVVGYVKQMAMLEGLSPEMRQTFLQAQADRDRAWQAESRLRQLEAQQQAEQQRLAEQQGVNAPDVKYVQDSIAAQMPDIIKANKIDETELFNHFLGQMLAKAAQGERDPRTGQYVKPPSIQLGRAPSRALLTQIAIAARQEADKYVTTSPKPAAKVAPPPTTPITGSGPSPREGQRGNIAQPQRRPFSDLATGTRPR